MSFFGMICILILLIPTVAGSKEMFMERELTIFCINLMDKVERREMIKKAYERFRYSFHFIPAIDTRGDKWLLYQHFLDEIGLNQIYNTLSNNYRKDHGDLLPGAIGCFISHILVWMMIQRSKQPFFLILEDDSNTPPDDFESHVDYILNHWPLGYDICFLNYSITMDGLVHLPNNSHFMIMKSKRCKFYLTNAYLISHQGAERLLSLLKNSDFRFHQQIDSWITEQVHHQRLKVCFYYEKICPQDENLDTSIQTIGVKS